MRFTQDNMYYLETFFIFWFFRNTSLYNVQWWLYIFNGQCPRGTSLDMGLPEIMDIYIVTYPLKKKFAWFTSARGVYSLIWCLRTCYAVMIFKSRHASMNCLKDQTIFLDSLLQEVFIYFCLILTSLLCLKFFVFQQILIKSFIFCD